MWVETDWVWVETEGVWVETDEVLSVKGSCRWTFGSYVFPLHIIQLILILALANMCRLEKLA